MEDGSIEQLLEDLKHSEPSVRDRATQSLWKRWFWQKGVTGLEQLQRSQELLDGGEPEAAEQLLNQLIELRKPGTVVQCCTIPSINMKKRSRIVRRPCA
jgi:hypothetical protein